MEKDRYTKYDLIFYVFSNLIIFYMRQYMFLRQGGLFIENVL